MYDPMQGALQNLAAVIAMRTNVGRMNEILEYPVQTGSETMTNQGCDIVFDHVGFAYNSGETVLKDVSFTAKQGEVTALVGPSGGGKTTVSRLAARFWDNQKGCITVGGMDISKIPAYKREINTVFQKYALFPHMNVFDNVAFGLNIKKMDKAVIKTKVERMLSMVGLANYGSKDVTLLSGGQQQRVAIARALVNEPKVLLLDEPLGALDARLRKEMQTELKKIQKEVGITFVFVTHDQEEALSMSDTVVVMNEGTIQQIGTPIDIYNEPENRFVAGFIGESNIIEGVMIKDFLVAFDDFEFICVDKGFPENEPVDVVIRPEDIDIVQPDKAKLKGIVKSVTFKGVHYETIVTTKYRDYRIDTTDYFAVGLEVGLTFTPEDIHVMWQMGSY